jgi:transposase
MWDLAELAIHIESKYDVIYQSQQSYYSLLKSAKISWKKSQKKNPQGSPKLVSKKKTEINQYSLFCHFGEKIRLCSKEICH